MRLSKQVAALALAAAAAAQDSVANDFILGIVGGVPPIPSPGANSTSVSSSSTSFFGSSSTITTSGTGTSTGPTSIVSLTSSTLSFGNSSTASSSSSRSSSLSSSSSSSSITTASPSCTTFGFGGFVMRLVSSNNNSPAHEKYARLVQVGVAGNAISFDITAANVDTAQQFIIRPGDCNLVAVGTTPVQIAMIDAWGGPAAQLLYPSETAATAEFPDGVWTRDICSVASGNILPCNVAGRNLFQIEQEQARLLIGASFPSTAYSVTIILEVPGN
ncbi:hypothetical protein CSOJ01_09256 [Colletotrichum sojae]|uniref:Uncharacterized protein n=1 Tax=Colletotrichum sojae TaxID=2175907 RepID=A0A8H6J3M1_9PEZI|nr:hypothetical protein CSOJ01_09256 [Colletotrichum sojae]